MRLETRAGVTVDRCARCDGLWFDARELDQCLAGLYPVDASPPEARIPRRGVSTRRCPRCERALETAGWTGLVLDRCGECRGLFVEAREIAQMERDYLPEDAVSFEARLQHAAVAAGWGLLTAQEVALLILRFLR
jgi:Zn-finger nucleic acid-binding protein